MNTKNIFFTVVIIFIEVTTFPIVNGQKFNCSNPTTMWPFRKCCNTPTYIDETLIDRCVNLHDPSGTKSIAAYLCRTECYYNATGFTVNRRLNLDAIMNHYKNIFRSPLWEPVINATFSTCINLVVNRENELRADRKNVISQAGGNCDFLSFYMNSCINVHLFRDCPVPHWVISDTCSTMQMFDDRCSLIPGLSQMEEMIQIS